MEPVTPADGGAADNLHRVADAAASAIDAAKIEASTRLKDGAEKIVETSHEGASRLRQAADGLEGEHAWLSSALLKSADGIEAAAAALKGGDVQKATAQLAGFAHRQPAVFIGACVAAGYVLSRVGKTALDTAAAGPAAGARTIDGQEA